ncbi:MAG: hypothetical protein GYA17_11525 [Chloroflexi bacterium]|nr:NBR1-Ig-like domain-containing protein [Anaerolineaceae bacterium]NMB88981.1 hypothetical protein [Chloroflexota bacterium]
MLRLQFLSGILGIAILLAGCAAPTPLVVTTAPEEIQQTADAARTEAVETAMVQVTTVIAMTPSATNTPTITSSPTATSTLAATIAPPTATRPPQTLAPTFTLTPGPLSCGIDLQIPSAGTVLTPGQDFDGRWTLRNIGTETWSASNVDFVFAGGQRMHEGGDTLDLNGDVAPDGTVDFVIDMNAPGGAGTYTTSWALSQSGTHFCTVTLSVEVQ